MRLRKYMQIGMGPSASSAPADQYIAWYDLQDITTLFQNEARTTPVTTDGQSIMGINDKSGNGYHVAQDFPGFLGTYRTSGINGFPAIESSGVLCLQSIVPVPIGNFTAFFVIQTTGGNIIYEHSANLNGNPGAYFNVAGSPMSRVRHAANTDAGTLSSRDATSNWGITASPIVATQHFVGPNTHRVFKNETEVTYDGGATVNPTEPIVSVTDTLNIGSRFEGSFGFVGFMGEARFLVPPTDDRRGEIIIELKAKGGIS